MPRPSSIGSYTIVSPWNSTATQNILNVKVKEVVDKQLKYTNIVTT